MIALWVYFKIKPKLEAIMLNLEALRAAVAKEHDVTEAAVILIQGLAEKLAAAINEGTSTEELSALVGEINEHAARLAGAITANTSSQGDSPSASPEQGIDPTVKGPAEHN